MIARLERLAARVAAARRVAGRETSRPPRRLTASPRRPTASPRRRTASLRRPAASRRRATSTCSSGRPPTGWPLKNAGGLLPLARGARIPPCSAPPPPTRATRAAAARTWTCLPGPLRWRRCASGSEVVHEVGATQRDAEGPLRIALTVEYPGGLSERRETSRLVWLRELPGSPPAGPAACARAGASRPPPTGRTPSPSAAATPAAARRNGREVAAIAPGDEERRRRRRFSTKRAAERSTCAPASPSRSSSSSTCTPRTGSSCWRPASGRRRRRRLARAVAAARAADVAVVVVGTTADVEAESRDRASCALPGDQEELIRAVAAANPRTIVVVNAGAAIDMPWSHDAAAVLYAWLGGQELGPALAAVLAGEAEPGGRLPFTIARRPGDYPVYATEPAPDGRVEYAEGSLAGRRHFDALGLEPAFCLGHGLGYTDFDYEAMSVADDAATVTVRNVGERAGKEVVQVYAGGRLAAFAAVRLAPGERSEVRLPLDPRALRRWDGGWTEPDAIALHAGRSSRDLRLACVRIRAWDRSTTCVARSTASG